MTQELKDIKNALLHLEWGEAILEGLDTGSISRTELHFIDRATGKEKLTCPTEDPFGRTHLTMPTKQVRKIASASCHRLRAHINEVIIEYAEHLKTKRNKEQP